jgi:magnesium transporter
MNERQEQTADVLGKLTVLGTIVLPLNIICGMWGMNVKVPGQEVDSLTWFYSSTKHSTFTSQNLEYIANFARSSHRWPGSFRLRLIPDCETGVQYRLITCLWPPFETNYSNYLFSLVYCCPMRVCI